MKGHYETLPDGRVLDRPPCGTCKYRHRMTIEAPCYSCVDIIDLASHKPNAETEFAAYTEDAENDGKEGIK